MHTRLVTLPLAGALLFALAAPRLASAAWPFDPSVNLPVCTAASYQQSPTIVADGAGGAIVTWSDIRTPANDYDIYAQHVLASGAVDPAWPANGLALCTAANFQVDPTIVSDGTGGAIITWNDGRLFNNADIYAQHVLASGAVDPAFPINGRALCTATNNQSGPTIVSDGAGGAIVTWFDLRTSANANDIYAQHVLASGAVDPAWPVNGRAVCTAVNDQAYPKIVADGAGGAIITWQDIRNLSNNDIYAQHVLASGAVDPAWPANGRALCTAASEQSGPVFVADGAGGAIVTWNDSRNGTNNFDIYSQHVLASGAVDPAWPTNGQYLCLAANNQTGPNCAADGAGGAIVTWTDSRNGFYDIYAEHVLASGAVDPAFPINGRALCTATNNQSGPTIVPDGAGGAIVTWEDARNGNPDIYAQHLLASGAVDLAWPVDGRALCIAGNYQQAPKIAADGAGGAIVTWNDHRGGANDDIYAQHVRSDGRLEKPAATITRVGDFLSDQGGKVRIAWTASYLDTLPTLEIAAYGIWRRVPESAARGAVARGARVLTEGDVAPAWIRPGVYRATWDQGQSFYWEGLGSILARGYASYTFVATTFEDSTALSNPYSVFMVDAHAAFLPGFWDSEADSGYSVDNLPPSTPAPFTGQYNAGTAHLHWNPNLEVDLAGYRLYRGNSASFIPGPGNLIAAPNDTGYADPAGALYYYKLSAIDSHDNQSGFALVLPSSTVDVPGPTLPRELALARPNPNPASGPVTLRFALPREMRVVLGIYDAGGRRVRTLVNGVCPAGERGLVWDLRDDAGHAVGAGLYFLRLEAEHRVLVQRLATLR